MTIPISKKVQTEFYAQGNAGVLRNPAGENFSNIGAALGGEINYKGTYLKAEAGAGTALSGRVELGHEFDIGKNLGFEISSKAQTIRNLKSNSYHTEFDTRMNGEINGVPYSIGNLHTGDSKWYSGETRLGAAAKLNFKSKNAKFGIGLEGGMRKSTARDVSFYFADHESVTVSVNGERPETVTLGAECTQHLNLNQKNGYITPTVSAEVNLGKKSGFSFVANADLYQGQAGIRYTF